MRRRPGAAGERSLRKVSRASFTHQPVLVDRVVALLSDVPAGWVVDATTGGGGHAAALLAAHAHLRLLGLDQDRDALAAAAARLASFGDRVVLRHTRFDGLAETVREIDAMPTTGVLFDLGVSSPQLDRPERGFSYHRDGPLDMRMDQSTGPTAADVVNGYAEADLACILRDHGDERYASRVARAIVAARPLTTTTELATIVRDAIPAPARRRGGHPARRTFQAIRIEVNNELGVLRPALEQALEVLAPGGRCVAIAYHSGEDRTVKATFREAATGGCVCPPGLPCICGATPTVRLLRRGAWRPVAEEITANPRAESARLRAVEKLEEVA